MKNIIIWSFLLIFLCALVQASDWGYVGQPLQLWGDVFANNQFFQATASNITVLAPNKSVVLRNVSGQLVQKGVFWLNFTPQSQGTYYAYATYFNQSGFIGQASQSFAVQSQSGVDMEIVTLFCFLLIGILFLIVAKYVEQPGYYGIAAFWFFGLALWQSVGFFNGVSLFSGNGLMTTIYIVLGLITVLHWYNETE